MINGAKQFITNAGTEITGCVTITAVTGGTGNANGNGAAAARSRTSSSRTGPPATRKASPTTRWAGTPPTRARSPSRTAGSRRSNLLGPRGDGFKQFLRVLDGGRIAVAAMGVGLAQGALDEALSYAKERRAFGQPISKFQAMQMKIADVSAQIEATRMLTYRAAIEKDRGEDFTLTAAQAKLLSGRLAVRATEEAVQIHGGYGYIEEYPVCRMYRDAKILTIGEGTDEAMQMVIARQLGC